MLLPPRSRDPWSAGTPPASPAAADLVLLAVGLSVVVAVSLWLAGRGLQDLAVGPGPGLTSIGRVTGLVASDLLLVQVLAMARVPWAERAFGQDRLARWHRMLGFTSFSLMVVHVVLVTLGYAVIAQVGVLPELWDLGDDLPGHAAGGRRHRAAGHGRRDVGARRPAPAPLRVMAPAAPLRLPRGRARAAAPALDGHRLRLLAGGPRLLVDALRRRAGRRARLPAGAARRPHPAAPPPSPGWTRRRQVSCRCT